MAHKKITEFITLSCKCCGKEYSVLNFARKKKFCSHSCAVKYLNTNHKNKGRKSGIEIKCEYSECKNIFYNSPSQNHRFCSLICFNNYKKSLRLKLSCETCNKEIVVNKFRAATTKFCSRKCKRLSDAHKEYLRRLYKGKTFEALYGKKRASEMIKKAIAFQSTRPKQSDETIRKRRVSYLKYKEGQVKNGKFYANYNIHACKLIGQYGKDNGYNFQHAENGGEFLIKELGYWLDGYDKEKNVAIEYYEKAHRSGAKLKRDKVREKEIKKHLKCKLIILREWEINKRLPSLQD